LLLNSNEFILPLSKGDAHALPLVLKANVPVSYAQVLFSAKTHT
jgi:hypothetical protein